MKIAGCDLHAKQQTIAMVDTETGEITEKTLAHEENKVREFYAALEGPVVVGIEATGAMQWFLQLLEELGIECRVGHPAKIGPKKHGSRSTIGGMRGWSWSCSWKIASRPSGCPQASSGTYERCCGIVISG